MSLNLLDKDRKYKSIYISRTVHFWCAFDFINLSHQRLNFLLRAYIFLNVELSSKWVNIDLICVYQHVVTALNGYQVQSLHTQR